MVKKIRKILFRSWRIVSGHRGIYCKMGKCNHFAEGVIIYELAKLGKYNYFSPYCLVSNARIGNYCSIGPGARIGLGEHDMKSISMRPSVANGEGNMEIFYYKRPSVLENDVWIGTNAVIKQGVKIGNGAVVGANSVVLEDVPDYAVVVGTPARIVRFRFDDEDRKKINESFWFEKDIDEAKKIVQTLKGSILS